MQTVTEVILQRNFDVFTEIDERLYQKDAKL